MSQTHITLGRLDLAVANALKKFSMARLAIEAETQAAEAFKTALATQQACILTGPNGVGKTESVLRNQQIFEADQLTALALSPESYRVQRVLYVPRLTGKTVRDCTLTLAGMVAPTTIKDRTQGSRVQDDDLMEQLVREMVADQYAVVIFDEMEEAHDAGFEFIRRLIASSQTADRGTPVTADGADEHGGTTESGSMMACEPDDVPRGRIGVIVVGTEHVAKELGSTENARGRWARFLSVVPMEAAEIASAYGVVFPSFAPHVAAVGKAAWHAFIEEHVTRGRRITVRHLENHCALYFQAMFERRLADVPEAPWTHRRQVPFDREMFLWALTEADTVPAATQRAKTRRRKVAR